MEVVDRLLSLLPTLPRTLGEFWWWVLIITVAHIVLTNLVKLAFYRQSPFSDAAAAAIGNRIGTALTFATSIMLLIGLARPRMLALVGDTKGFLALAAVAGIYYGIVAIGRRD